MSDILPPKPPEPPKPKVNNLRHRTESQLITSDSIQEQIPRELYLLFDEYRITSPRLQETAFLIGSDMTNEEIALELEIGVRSVNKYMYTLMNKWGYTSREPLYEMLESKLMPSMQRKLDEFNNGGES